MNHTLPSDGLTEQISINNAGQTAFANYDIVWTDSAVQYYQNGVLMATHTNSPVTSMGALIEALSPTMYAYCDWIFLHKYAPAEPSNSFGQEEQYEQVNDFDAPGIILVSPTNETVLISSTTSVTITLATDENADCRYSLTNPSFDYVTEGIAFTSGQGTLLHSFSSFWIDIGSNLLSLL